MSTIAEQNDPTKLLGDPTLEFWAEQLERGLVQIAARLPLIDDLEATGAAPGLVEGLGRIAEVADIARYKARQMALGDVR